VRAFDAFRRSVARSLPDRPRLGAARFRANVPTSVVFVSGSLDEDGKQRLTVNDARLPIWTHLGHAGGSCSILTACITASV
jgi:hypothetical protein